MAPIAVAGAAYLAYANRDKIFGSGDDPGWLGTGHFQGGAYRANDQAFTNVDSGYNKAMADHYLAETNKRAAPTAQAATAQDKSLGQGYQAQLMAQLAQQAQGKGPSLASLQMQQGVDASLRAQMAAAASQKGNANSALAMRSLQANAAAQQQQAAGQAAQLKMQEQLAAQQQLAGVSAADRSAYAQYSLANAGFQQQAALANQQAVLQNRSLTDAQRRAMLGMRAQFGEADRQAAMEKEKLLTQASLGELGVKQKAYESAGEHRGQMISSIGSMVAGAAGSDERMKTGKTSGTDALHAMFDAYSRRSATPSHQPAFAPASHAMGSPEHSYYQMPTYEKTQVSADPYLADDGGGGGSSGSSGGMDRSAMMGMMLKAGASSSDEKAKANVEPGEKRLREMLGALDAHSYRYKDPSAPGAGPGTFVSPMAQEFEKSSMGKEAVFEGPDGHKMVDYGHLAGAQWAALADMHERLKKVEGTKVHGGKSGSK